MFSNLLHKSFQVGDKLFHVLADININTQDLKNFAVEVIKFASEVDEKNRIAVEESQKVSEPVIEEKIESIAEAQ